MEMVFHRGETAGRSIVGGWAEVSPRASGPLLLDREDDLAAIDAALAEAVGGTGGIVLIEGRLPGSVRPRCSMSFADVPVHRESLCGPHGPGKRRGFGLGAVRQLLGGTLAFLGANAAERTGQWPVRLRLAEPVFTEDRRGRGHRRCRIRHVARVVLARRQHHRTWAVDPDGRRRPVGRRTISALPAAPRESAGRSAGRHRADRPSRCRYAAAPAGFAAAGSAPPILRPKPRASPQ